MFQTFNVTEIIQMDVQIAQNVDKLPKDFNPTMLHTQIFMMQLQFSDTFLAENILTNFIRNC